MSPASQGGLEVERYIGSCLITSSSGCGGRPGLHKSFAGCRKQDAVRPSKPPQQQQQQYRSYEQQQCQFGDASTWAGGAPLINMASNPRRVGNANSSSSSGHRSSPPGQQSAMSEQQQQQQHRVPLARLAVHTQGAPLILSGRYHSSRGNKLHGGQQQQQQQQNNNKCVHPLQSRPKPATFEPRRAAQQGGKPGGDATGTTGNAASIDSLSIASDESSGSNNSENSLPRIIKPRKRRKKDRKPPTVLAGLPDGKIGEEAVVAAAAAAAAAATTTTASTTQAMVSEQQQQHQQQMKAYQAYEGGRYPGEHYYSGRGPRRSMNNPRDAGCYPGRLRNNSSVSSNSQQQQQEVVDTRQSQQLNYPAQRHVQVKVLDDNRNVILPVPVCQASKANYLQQRQQQRFLHHEQQQQQQQQRCGSSEPVVTLAPCRQEPPSGPEHLCASDDCAAAALCQCRYCEPATLVWDVSERYRRQYHQLAGSEFGGAQHHHHHHHHHRYSQMPAATVFLARPVICQEHHPNAIDLIDVTDNPCLRLRTNATAGDSGTADNSSSSSSGSNTGAAAMLRRSWSDPSSYFSSSDDGGILPLNRDVGVIGDRGGDSKVGRSCWRGDASTAPPPGSSSAGQAGPGQSGSSGAAGAGSANGGGGPGLPGPLEVSTEIVTSPNGHRDLEIKFYSSSPSSYYSSSSSSGNEDSPPPGRGPEDAEEFSDIWSYHESKLQQDFRTLLQAEE